MMHVEHVSFHTPWPVTSKPDILSVMACKIFQSRSPSSFTISASTVLR